MLFSVNEPDLRDANTPEQAAKIDRSIRILTIIVIALAAVFLINMLSTRVFAPSSNYKNGTAAMQEGKYAEAVEYFTAAGDYKDAADQLARAKQSYANLLAGKENALSYTTASMPWYSVTEDGMFAFAKDDYEKVEEMLPNPGEIIIPDVLDGILITAIKEKTFLNADTVTSVVIPDKVTALPDSLFYNAAAMQSVTLPASLTVIAQRAFINCASLQSVTLPAGVREIGLRAFNNCYALTSADLGACESLTTLESYTFSECYALAEVSLPASLTSIEENVFINCESLKTVRFGGTEAEWNAISIAEGNEALLNANIVFGG
ncbi:MAG: leucine-rich repeat domain-containing protein [Ruminococcaceae bacterium]|nr:leucine-rich repeat domain-containing protein [Oscillospiraceae bacterium]